MFILTTKPRSYYDPAMWRDPDAPALYFGGFAILPEHQNKGIGSWCLEQVDRMARERGLEAVRFDAAHFHKEVHAYYERRGYRRVGLIQRDWGGVVCFEKLLLEDG